MDGPSPRSSWPAVIGLVALPWIWFAVRDGTGWVGDLVAILLPVAVVLCVVVALVAAVRRRRWRWLVPAASVLAVGALAVVGPGLPADPGAIAPGRATTVAGANVTTLDDLSGELLALSSDVLVVAEQPLELEPALVAAYPYAEQATGGPSVGVYSRWPMRLLEKRTSDLPGLRVEVTGPAGPFVLYALHVPRPWFTTAGGYQATVAEHHGIMRALAGRIAAEPGPVVVVGDLNSSDRSRDYREILRDGHLVDAMRDTRASATSVGKWSPLLLRIDHVLVSRGWCGDGAGTAVLPGSDHLAVEVAVGPCRGAAAAPRPQ